MPFPFRGEALKLTALALIAVELPHLGLSATARTGNVLRVVEALSLGQLDSLAIPTDPLHLCSLPGQAPGVSATRDRGRALLSARPWLDDDLRSAGSAPPRARSKKAMSPRATAPSSHAPSECAGPSSPGAGPWRRCVWLSVAGVSCEDRRVAEGVGASCVVGMYGGAGRFCR